MDFSGVLNNIINTYGWLGLIVVVMVICIICVLPTVINRTLDKTLTKNNDKLGTTVTQGMDAIATKLSEGMTSQNQILISTLSNNQEKMLDNQNELFKYLIMNHTKEEKKIEEHEQGIDLRKTNSTIINSILLECIKTYNCRRASVIEFHNSKENLNGLPFVWYDIQYEAVQKGATTLSGICKDQQISIISPIINLVQENNKVILQKDDIYNLPSSVFVEEMQEIKTTGLVYVGLWNTYNKLIGLLCLEYKDNEIPDMIYQDGILGLSSWLSKLLTKDILLQ